MRWVATYRGGSSFNKADGLFNISQIRKIGFDRGNDKDGRYLAIILKPEEYVIYETKLDIEARPRDPHELARWKDQHEALVKKIMIDVIAELGREGSDQEIVDLMQRFGFRE
jgi:hypothetical protein